jgi:hypothetical protein
VKRVRIRTARFHSVFGSTDGYGIKICFVHDFILHTAYTVDACALTSILPSLSLMDTTYCRSDTKATQASVQGVGVDFLIWIPRLHNVLIRVFKRTARLRFVFYSTDCYGV